MTVALCGDGLRSPDKSTPWQQRIGAGFALTFFDSPFNQGKEYTFFDEELPPEEWR
jgi:hypothetical protein